MKVAEKKASKISPEQVTEWLKLVFKDKVESGWRISTASDICFQALEVWCNYKLTQKDLRLVITEMKNKGQSSFDEFETAVADYSNHAPHEPEKEWTFIVPFQIEFENGTFPKIRLCGQDFEFWNSSQVIAYVGKPKTSPYDLRLDTILHNKPYQSYIVSKFSSSAFLKAWRHVNRPFDALLGLLELTSNLGVVKAGWGVGGIAHTRFPRPKWVISFSPEEGPSLNWFNTEYGDYEEKPTTKVTQRTYEGLIQNASLFKEPPDEDSIYDLLVTGLVLYAQALDGRQPHSRLLGLWQLAETLTLSDRFNGKTDTICNRLLAFDSIFSFDRNAVKAALQTVASKRNDFVHRGLRYHIEDRHVHTLKLTVESLLFQLSDIANKIKTINTLEYYYQLYAKNGADMSALRQAVKFLRTSERKKKLKKN